MQSASSIGSRVLGLVFLVITMAIPAFSQDNSPWSRYGLGDITPSSNIVSRGMGHTAAAYSDFQTINFVNPASYSRFGAQRAILDLGLDINSRTLRNTAGERYTSNNAYIPYLAAGFQLKGEKQKREWGLAFGLRPVTKVSYNIVSGGRITAGDSTITNYVGEGGTYQAFLGTAVAFNKLSIGVNFGYRFGSKDYNTSVYILNDTATDRYVAGRKMIKNSFGGAFAELGVQYLISFNKKSNLQLGAYGSMQGKLKNSRDEMLETFVDANGLGNLVRVDSVSDIKNIKGNIEYPSYYGFGFLYDREGKGRLNISMDYVTHKWSQYRYYGSKDLMQDAWQVNIGSQYLPDVTGKKGSFWNNVLYRGGVHFGKEPYTFAGNMNSYGITLGAGIPIRKYTYAEVNKNNLVNVALEFGQRGKREQTLRENYFRFTVGFSLSDIWFIKRKYD